MRKCNKTVTELDGLGVEILQGDSSDLSMELEDTRDFQTVLNCCMFLKNEF
jgi:hypothetical protein